MAVRRSRLGEVSVVGCLLIPSLLLCALGYASWATWHGGALFTLVGMAGVVIAVVILVVHAVVPKRRGSRDGSITPDG